MATPADRLLAAFAEAHNAKTPGDPTDAARSGVAAILVELAAVVDRCMTCGKTHARRWIEGAGRHTWADPDDGHAYRQQFRGQGGEVAVWLRALAGHNDTEGPRS